MKIKDTFPLVLYNLYVYDIRSCHYTILEKLGIDLHEINKEDKEQRNISIGKMMRKNPNLTTILRTTTESIVDNCIRSNRLGDSEIVLKQYDGIITTRSLSKIDGDIPLELRRIFQVFISSYTRNMYIALDNLNRCVVKGVPNYYDKLEVYYKKLCNLASLPKKSLFVGLEELKERVLNEKVSFYSIPKNGDKCTIITKNFGAITISKTALRLLDLEVIDRWYYFDTYFDPFVKSLVLSTMQQRR